MSYDIDITNTPPAHEPERQYYYMAKAKDFVEKKSKEIGRPNDLFCKDIRVSDECARLRKACRNTRADRLR